MKRNVIVRLLFVSLLTAVASPAGADVKLNGLFADHAVLQQGVPLPVWGTADPGESVTIRFDDQERSATAGTDGRWSVRLDALKPGEPRNLIARGKNTVEIHDLLVGEVWLCSGQSNMQFIVSRPSGGVLHEKEEVAAANYPQIRMLTVGAKGSDEPRSDFSGRWTLCSPEAVGRFSAVAYFFGREIHLQQHVPVGLIVSAFGGSKARAWISEPALRSSPMLAKYLGDYAEARKRYTPEMAAEDAAANALWQAEATEARANKRAVSKTPASRDPRQSKSAPSLLYNGMINPLLPYGIRGVLWYQGESDAVDGQDYALQLSTLIESWRQAWRQPALPFLIVQLPNFNASSATRPSGQSRWAELRAAQARCAAMPNTAMAVTIDVGEANDVHPKNKQVVAHRLALLADARVYGGNVVADSPSYASLSRQAEGIVVRFNHAAGGLVAKGERIDGFTLAGPDGEFVPAEAHIDGETVVLVSSKVKIPTKVRYAWADNPRASIFSRADLPAAPFSERIP